MEKDKKDVTANSGEKTLSKELYKRALDLGALDQSRESVKVVLKPCRSNCIGCVGTN